MASGNSADHWTDIEVDYSSPSKACCNWPICFHGNSGGGGETSVTGHGEGSTPGEAKANAKKSLTDKLRKAGRS